MARRGVLLVAGALLGSAVPALGQGYVLWTFNGGPDLDLLGHSVAGVGDVDGDGFADVLVGAPGVGFLTTSFAAGYAKVFSGGSGSALLTFNGSAASNDGLGTTVAAAGDLDADGVPDVLLGLVGSDAGGLANAGEVRAFSGSSGALLFSIGGDAPETNLGWTLAAVGDTTGDGVREFLVGETSPGVRLFSGSDGSLLAVLPLPGWSASLAAGGDVTGDGIPEFIVGVESVNLARVYDGGTLAVLYSFSVSLAEAFGSSVGGAGDVDGDGDPDWIVGARGMLGSGYARVFSGASGLPLFTVSGSGAAAQFGYSVAGMGDVDGDGLADLAVGSPGLGNPPTRVFSGDGGALLFTFPGPQAFGRSVAAAGDVNADGIPDLVVGADSASSVQGEAQVISGTGIPFGSSLFGSGCPGTGGFSPRISTFGGSPSPGNASFGFSVSRGCGGASATLFLGTAPTLIGAPVGGCPQHLAGTIFPVAGVTLAGPAGAGGGGHRLVGVPLPPSPALAGLTVALQWVILDSAAANGFFATSDSITVTVQ